MIKGNDISIKFYGRLWKFLLVFLWMSPGAHAQLKGLYFGYQAAVIPGGMNNLRSLVGSEELEYSSLEKDMKYRNFLHGLSVGWSIRGHNPLFTYGDNRHPFMELNWNNLHNSFTSRGTGMDSVQTTSRYHVRFNGMGVLFGFPINDHWVFKAGFAGANFAIRYKKAHSDKFDQAKYQDITDPEGFPVPYLHFGLDMPVSSRLYMRTYLNLTFDIAKENGLYYNVHQLGIQMVVPLKNQTL